MSDYHSAINACEQELEEWMDWLDSLEGPPNIVSLYTYSQKLKINSNIFTPNQSKKIPICLVPFIIRQPQDVDVWQNDSSEYPHLSLMPGYKEESVRGWRDKKAYFSIWSGKPFFYYEEDNLYINNLPKDTYYTKYPNQWSFNNGVFPYMFGVDEDGTYMCYPEIPYYGAASIDNTQSSFWKNDENFVGEFSLIKKVFEKDEDGNDTGALLYSHATPPIPQNYIPPFEGSGLEVSSQNVSIYIAKIYSDGVKGYLPKDENVRLETSVGNNIVSLSGVEQTFESVGLSILPQGILLRHDADGAVTNPTARSQALAYEDEANYFLFNGERKISEDNEGVRFTIYYCYIIKDAYNDVSENPVYQDAGSGSIGSGSAEEEISKIYKRVAQGIVGEKEKIVAGSFYNSSIPFDILNEGELHGDGVEDEYPYFNYIDFPHEDGDNNQYWRLDKLNEYFYYKNITTDRYKYYRHFTRQEKDDLPDAYETEELTQTELAAGDFALGQEFSRAIKKTSVILKDAKNVLFASSPTENINNPTTQITEKAIKEFLKDRVVYKGEYGQMAPPLSEKSTILNGVSVSDAYWISSDVIKSKNYLATIVMHCGETNTNYSSINVKIEYHSLNPDNENAPLTSRIIETITWEGTLEEFIGDKLLESIQGLGYVPMQDYRFLSPSWPTPTGSIKIAAKEHLYKYVDVPEDDADMDLPDFSDYCLINIRPKGNGEEDYISPKECPLIPTILINQENKYIERNKLFEFPESPQAEWDYPESYNNLLIPKGGKDDYGSFYEYYGYQEQIDKINFFSEEANFDKPFILLENLPRKNFYEFRWWGGVRMPVGYHTNYNEVYIWCKTRKPMKVYDNFSRFYLVYCTLNKSGQYLHIYRRKKPVKQNYNSDYGLYVNFGEEQDNSIEAILAILETIKGDD